jgi:hypothetical protein
MPTLQNTIQKVKGFVELPDGWHFGDGVPAPRDRIEQAVRFLEFANQLGLGRANAFPGITGQVEITFYYADRMLEVTIESDDSITIAEDQGREQVSFEENRSKRSVYEKLQEFSQNIWASSDLFIVNTTTLSVRSVRGSASQVAHSTFTAGSPFPLLTLTARNEKTDPYVAILPGITVSNLAIPQSTGQYRTRLFPQGVESRQRELLAGMNAIGTSTIGEEKLFAEVLRL